MVTDFVDEDGPRKMMCIPVWLLSVSMRCVASFGGRVRCEWDETRLTVHRVNASREAVPEFASCERSPPVNNHVGYQEKSRNFVFNY